MKHVIETNLLQLLLNTLLNSIHPNNTVSSINELIQRVKSSIVPFEEPKPCQKESDDKAEE